MDYYDEWAEDCLTKEMCDKLYARGYHWFGTFKDVDAPKLLQFLTPEELEILRREWPHKNTERFPFLCDGLPFLGAGI